MALSTKFEHPRWLLQKALWLPASKILAKESNILFFHSNCYQQKTILWKWPWLFTAIVKPKVLFWYHSEIAWPTVDGMVADWLMRSRVHVFLLTWILIKTISRKFHGLRTESFADSVKHRYLSKLHSGSRNKGGNWWFIFLITLHKKWSFPLTISSVNVTKSAVFCRFVHIYWKNS